MTNKPDMIEEEAIHREVRRHYAAAAGTALREEQSTSGCCDGSETADPSCGCTDTNGYTPADLASDAAEANLGLGCGNPIALASLRPGEVVLDLGSGAGFDCLLAAERVGETGRVIGVDMTPEMVSRARLTAVRRSIPNVEFRLGEIEHLPLADGSVDVVISNCVVNLVPDKALVYAEAYRVLRKGGRLAIADIVALRPLPGELRSDLSQYVACVAGALEIPVLRRMLAAAGFVDIDFVYRRGDDGDGEPPVASALITARKL